jgi:hypothetical protein
MIYDTSSVLDLTPQQTMPPGRPEKYNMRGRKVVLRDPKNVTGVVIHQTACVFGVSNNQVKLAGGDPVLAKHRRALNIGAHVTAFMTGKAVYANPLDWYVYHGNGFNAFCDGLEIEGLYCGLKGRQSTAAGDPKKITMLTRATIDAARTGLTFIVERRRAMGSPMEWVYAHRQSSASRRSDPGEEIWYEVVLNYAVPVLGLRVNNSLVLPASNRRNGPGYPIPKEWDASATARY